MMQRIEIAPGHRWGSLGLRVLLCGLLVMGPAVQSASAQTQPSPGPEESETEGPREGAPTVPMDDGGEDLEPAAAYEQARTMYLSGQFDQCVEAFDALLDPNNERRLSDTRRIERARLYYAACLMGLGRDADAQEQMRAAILANPRMLPPNPLVFPAPVVSRFAVVHSGLLKELQAKEDAEVREAQQRAREDIERAAKEHERILILEDLAAKESVVVQNRRWIAALPFGVGQFQNGDDALGWFFLTSEGVLATSVIAATSYELWLHSAGQTSDVDVQSFNGDVAQARNVQRWSLVGLGILAAFGVTEAQLSYVPERKIGDRERELPRAIRSGSLKRQQRGLRWMPGVSPTVGGAALGLSGWF